MSMEQLRNGVERRVVGGLLIGALGAGCLAVAGCEGRSPDMPPPPSQLPKECPTALPKIDGDGGDVKITFFDRCGGSSIIKVYSDVSERSANVGTYSDGNTAVATCKLPGRNVSPDVSPSANEVTYPWDDSVTNEWVKITAPALGERVYASATYIESASQVLGELKDCNVE